jgi:pimeloyl-ACP methyl ester carboxylesterase
MSPRQHEPQRLGLPGDRALAGDLFFQDAVGPAAVLYVHGFASNRRGQKAQALEDACLARGWTFAAFDLRGHGDSWGTLADLRGGGLQDDLDAVHDFLQGRDVRKLFLVGSSMGGWAGAWFTARHPRSVAACVFIAPAFRFLGGVLERLAGDARERWRQTRRLSARNLARDTDEELDYALTEDAERFRPEDLAARWRTPALILHSIQDETVPFGGSVDFVTRTAAQPLELRLFRDGDHRNPLPPQDLAAVTAAFFARRGL